tara:strand:+ start:293 stop:874 length:582 start_codon:yes stop_codon:yes gene_type:complete
MDLTTEFSRISNSDWKLPMRKLNTKFTSSVASIKDGLYLMIISNPHKQDVYDDNSKPKVVIKANSISVKAGKFTNGIINRRKDDFGTHLHYTNAGTKHMLGSSTINLLYVIDLSSAHFITSKTADCFEKILIQSMQKELDIRKWDAHTTSKSTEWRHIKARVPLASLKKVLEPKVSIVEKVINDIITSYKGRL